MRQTMADRKVHQRHLGGVTGHHEAAVAPPHALGVVAVEEGVEERAPPFGFAGADQAPSGEKTTLAGLDDEPVHVKPIHGHPVLGQRPRFVGANHRRAPERLDRRQVFDQGLALRHTLAAHGQGQRDSRQQAFRHVRDDDADAEDGADPESEPRAQADEKKQRAHRQRNGRDDASDLTDFLLQRTQAGFDRRGQVGNLAELRAHPGCKHDGAAVPGKNRRAGKEEVRQIEPMAVFDGVGGSAFGFGFAGQGGVVHPQVGAVDQPRVARNLLAFLQQEHVARNDLRTHDLDRLAASQHPRLFGKQPMQRLNRPLRLVLLQKGKQRVDADDPQDGPAQRRHAFAGLHGFGGKRQGGGHPQEYGQKVREVAGQATERLIPAGIFQHVGTEL